MKRAAWILTFALVAFQPARALADETLEYYQQQCAAAVKAHDDGATIAACQRAALDNALYAAKQVGESRYTLLLQEGSDILDFSRSEGKSGNVAMAQKDATQARTLFAEIAGASHKDATIAAAQAGVGDAEALLAELAAKQP
ncbi:MAG TPA: hypothetical protein VHS56_06155 [Candidatus Cybelea sp.]|nr:hypothetical protein [Candidatus Cybelea sp.]